MSPLFLSPDYTISLLCSTATPRASKARTAALQWHYGDTNLLHSRSRASELLSGKLKGLSRAMMQRLHDEWRIPAEILIRDCCHPPQ